jgi:hypothetical protein
MKVVIDLHDRKKITHHLLDKLGRAIVRQAVIRCPNDEGFLSSKIGVLEIDDVRGEVVVGTRGVPYAEHMEYGKPPGLLSSSEKDDVEDWARRHGLKSGKGVIWSLEHKGIKVGSPENPLHITSLGRNSYRPFLRPALLHVANNPNAALRSVQ